MSDQKKDWRTIAFSMVAVVVGSLMVAATRPSNAEVDAKIEGKLEAIHIRFDYLEKQHEDFKQQHERIWEKVK